MNIFYIRPIIISASSERILAWNLPSGEIAQEIHAEEIAINSVAVNRLGVTVAGGKNFSCENKTLSLITLLSQSSFLRYLI